jgi:hypothetical protein
MGSESPTVSLHRKAALRGYLVVIPDNEGSEPCVRGVAPAIDSKVAPGVEPVTIPTFQGIESSQLQHRIGLAVTHLPTGTA